MVDNASSKLTGRRQTIAVTLRLARRSVQSRSPKQARAFYPHDDLPRGYERFTASRSRSREMGGQWPGTSPIRQTSGAGPRRRHRKSPAATAPGHLAHPARAGGLLRKREGDAKARRRDGRRDEEKTNAAEDHVG